LGAEPPIASGKVVGSGFRALSRAAGDALKQLPKLEGRFDFVFLDALKRDYPQ
jgi:predicted O-methyltransferase YrrM